MTRKQAALAGIAPYIEKLASLDARCMEQVIDPCGVVVERWLTQGGLSVVIYGTPHWRDAFVSVAPLTNSWSDSLDALEKVLRS